ncbi:MAG: hypothetical protein KMY53_14890 [Desulfarculus sp.]|nr:hypothetical protein [Pseudomonadota bacterium]MBU4576594.1 hypothetical protein [Pseudomonadota bacterium]MBV1717936.1 hypothetical protein [Desulfarculus sp.]MBV1739450.1 hypothetical protein [Desulfarculus sp.]MBV1753242.1 hypothetical protein [Desulfarculus sp.]
MLQLLGGFGQQIAIRVERPFVFRTARHRRKQQGQGQQSHQWAGYLHDLTVLFSYEYKIYPSYQHIGGTESKL